MLSLDTNTGQGSVFLDLSEFQEETSTLGGWGDTGASHGRLEFHGNSVGLLKVSSLDGHDLLIHGGSLQEDFLPAGGLALG